VPACAAWAQDETPDSATSGPAALDSFLASVESLSAQFRQDVWTADHELVETTVGTMSLKRPDRFYWHYETPTELIVVADGEALWMYDVELAQVSKTPLGDVTAATPAMLLSGDAGWRDEFDVAQTYRLEGRDWVKLAPKAGGSDYSSVLIGFGAGLPEQLELVDGLDQTTRIEFSAIVVNAPLDESLFTFAPPPGTDVIGNHE
jgi:chaperone LolA